MHTLAYGPVKGTNGDSKFNVRQGALEKLLGDDDNAMDKLTSEQFAYSGESIARETKEITMPKELFNAVIYNPPFTDTSKQGRRYNDQTMSAMRQRLQLIKTELAARDPAAEGAISMGSISPFFTPLAKSLLSKDGGKLAKIIPATACTSKNGRNERQYIAAHHHIEMIITSHDPKYVNFSENTSIHECLIIGTRGKTNKEPTRFIQLAKYPSDVKEADELLAAIESGNGKHWYSETSWSVDKIEAGDWTPVQWFNSRLAEAACEINTLPKLIIAGDAYEWTDTAGQYSSHFDYRINEATPGKANSFCTIAENIMQTIQAAPETEATLKPNKSESIWKKASRFLIIMRFRTTNTRLLAIHSKQPALGSTWFSIAVNNIEEEQAFAAFINSSFGIIQMLNRRTRILTYTNYEVGHLRTLMLPDPKKANLKPLLAAFNEVKDMPLKRLADCANDPARKILDHAAATAIGINPAITDQWRQWLSEEPTITSKPYQAW